MTRRLPDFVLVGAMKSGTTSMFRWFAAQPDFVMPRVKEPRFFSDDDVWERGLDWYGSLFAAAGRDVLTGEASVAYTSPEGARRAAPRIAETLPDARLIYLVRDPVARLRSHYRHQLQRGRERRSLSDAIADPSSPYITYSLYWQRLAPYLEVIDAERICVVRFEDVVDPGRGGWNRVLAHLGASPRPAPTTPYNLSAAKASYTRPLLWLTEHWGVKWTRRGPRSLRRAGKQLLTRHDAALTGQLESSESTPVPPDVLERLAEDEVHLERWLGADQPLWPR
ncbi:MAG: hypothetical protein QOI95_3275 [Acidimicrobiaceae bacterium]